MTGDTSAAVLFGTDLGAALRRSGVVATVASALGGGAALPGPLGAELARACAAVVDLDLAWIALQGWRKHRDLRAAATRTAAEPGRTERVTLAEHVITSEHHPHLEVALDGRPAVAIPVTVVLTLRVLALDATVRDGALVGLHGGDAEVAGTLAVHGVVLSEPPPRRIALGRDLPAGTYLSLLPGSERRTAAHRASHGG